MQYTIRSRAMEFGVDSSLVNWRLTTQLKPPGVDDLQLGIQSVWRVGDGRGTCEVWRWEGGDVWGWRRVESLQTFPRDSLYDVHRAAVQVIGSMPPVLGNIGDGELIETIRRAVDAAGNRWLTADL
jgi:hypothetical protein